VTLREERMPVFSLFVKRAVDKTTAAAILAFSAPLLTTIALVIKFESPGPVFYQAERVGLKGRRFRCYKFRTMSAGADKLKSDLRAQNERQGPFFKMADDPRITRAGRFLRRYSLDELPQLWNVVRGEMSLVGPRPHPLDDFERYELGDLQRLDVPPGLTGLWQVTARRDPSFERSLALDLEYIRSWTLWRDFLILYKTVSVVLQGSGV
jgi:lipopolysaccharide/colanic/teichoic acid biosynthesis glycosyltransferase